MQERTSRRPEVPGATAAPWLSLDAGWAFWALALAATGVGAALRLHALGEPSFWVDEFFTIGRAGIDPLDWQRWLGYLPTRLSLGYYGADLTRISLENIEAWPSLGVSEHRARMGSAWCGIAALPILAFVARPVVGGAAAGVAALVLAVVPDHIYWSQMARFYSAQFVFTTLFMLLVIRGLQADRWGPLAGAAIAGILAYLCHLTAVFVIAACFSGLLGVLLLRWNAPGLRKALIAVFATGLTCGVLILLRETGKEGSSPLEQLAGQHWDADFLHLLLGTFQRFQPAVVLAAVAATIAAFRYRDPVALVLAAIALGVPAIAFLLDPIFPIGWRYFFPALAAWILLAVLWATDVERRLRAATGPLPSLAVVGLLLTPVAFNAYLYSDGAGHRDRWRDAFAYVKQHAAPADLVISLGGQFQSRYYTGQDLLGNVDDREGLPHGAWVVHRGPRPLSPSFDRFFHTVAVFEVPSKPWSQVLYVLRAPLDEVSHATRAGVAAQ